MGIKIKKSELPLIGLKYKGERELEFETEEVDGYYRLVDGRFHICIYAESREELERELLEEVKVMWECYVLASDDVLTKEAIRLKQRLKRVFREVE